MLPGQLGALCYFKIGKFEAWGHGAPHEGPRLPISYVRSEPVPGRNYGLKNLASIGIVSQVERGIGTCPIDNVHEQG